LLLLASYLWGGCVSCEQFFMLPGAENHCCKTGKCDRPGQSKTAPARQDCQRMPLDQVPGAHPHFETAIVAAGPILPAPVENAPADHSGLSISPAVSPPDLPILNSSLLV
jgi:hypothetical protein